MGDLGKLIVAKGPNLPKIQEISQSGHTDAKSEKIGATLLPLQKVNNTPKFEVHPDSVFQAIQLSNKELCK